jgi:hypothetical protein
VLDVVDRLGDEVAHMVVVQGVNDAVAVAPPGDKAKVAEDPKLVRDRGRLELHTVGEIGDGAWRLPQPRQDANPARSGERLHRFGDLFSEVSVDRRQRKTLPSLKMPHDAASLSEEMLRLSASLREARPGPNFDPLSTEKDSTLDATWRDAQSPLAIGDLRRRDGAFMEPSGRNRWQPVANETPPKTAQTRRSATSGNPRQPFRSAW